MNTATRLKHSLISSFNRFQLNFRLHMALATAMFTCCALALLLLCIHDWDQQSNPRKQDSRTSLNAQQPLGWLKESPHASPTISSITPSDLSGGSAVVISRGSEQNDQERAYQCKTGFTPIDMPLGSATQFGGNIFRLTEKRSGQSEYDDQLSVHLRVKLDSRTTVPTIIINTAAHNMEPTLYPQFKKQVALEPGAVADYTFATAGYAGNFQNAGITDITLCTLR